MWLASINRTDLSDNTSPKKAPETQSTQENLKKKQEFLKNLEESWKKHTLESLVTELNTSNDIQSLSNEKFDAFLYHISNKLGNNISPENVTVWEYKDGKIVIQKVSDTYSVDNFILDIKNNTISNNEDDIVVHWLKGEYTQPNTQLSPSEGQVYALGSQWANYVLSGKPDWFKGYERKLQQLEEQKSEREEAPKKLEENFSLGQ